MNTERDKFLLKAMGLCWHEWNIGMTLDKNNPHRWTCNKCLEFYYCLFQDLPLHLDFSTWYGFGVLWDWAIKQEWWRELKVRMFISRGIHYEIDTFISFINPDRFADVVYEFLKGETAKGST